MVSNGSLSHYHSNHCTVVPNRFRLSCKSEYAVVVAGDDVGSDDGDGVEFGFVDAVGAFAVDPPCLALLFLAGLAPAHGAPVVAAVSWGNRWGWRSRNEIGIDGFRMEVVGNPPVRLGEIANGGRKLLGGGI